MDWLKKAPTGVVIGFFVLSGLLAMAVLGAYVVLSLYGNADSLSDFRQWVQTLGITIVVPLLGINTVASIAGARSASNAEDQTNGQLTALQRENAALKAQIGERTDG